MKNVFILILFLILFSINVYAQEQIEINLFRENQIANEVFQAEIILNEKPEKDLTINNLILSNTKKISIAPLFTKISENKYFIYFDLPF